MSSVLYFDIGNTCTKIAVAGPCEAWLVYSLPTQDRQTADCFGLSLLELLRHSKVDADKINACVAASVVPAMGALVAEACRRFLGRDLLFVPDSIEIPLRNCYERPHEVGADRLVGAFAARMLFPESASIICVDFGTATTFDCVQGNSYLGGLICPGVHSSIRALAMNTAKLPHVDLSVDSVGPEPGRSTAISLSHGFVFGFVAMTEGLCRRLSKTLDQPVAIIGTGGFSSVIASVSNCFHLVRPFLLLEGLQQLYENHVASARQV